MYGTHGEIHGDIGRVILLQQRTHETTPEKLREHIGTRWSVLFFRGLAPKDRILELRRAMLGICRDITAGSIPRPT